MNVRKNIDYTEMYEALDVLMGRRIPQMELYREIGKVVCRRTEKGAAVVASEYLNKHYPDVKGFSPRSLRRMRDFYRTYENHPALLSHAMKLRLIQNVVIMDADLTMDLREWYLKAAEQFSWSKTELINNIAATAHENIVLTIEEELYNVMKHDKQQNTSYRIMSFDNYNMISQHVRRIRKCWLGWKGRRRRCQTLLWEIFVTRWRAFLRCLIESRVLDEGLRSVGLCK